MPFYDSNRKPPYDTEGGRVLKESVSRRRNGMYRVVRQVIDDGAGQPYVVVTAVNDAGEYIGPVDRARYLSEKGVQPILRSPDHKVCSIGKSSKDGKWYGWSHRAMYGFGIGDSLKPGDCGTETFPAGRVAVTEADARAMAEAFADDVA